MRASIQAVPDRERDILERAVAAVAEQAARADALIDDLQAAGLPEDGRSSRRSSSGSSYSR